MINEKIDLHGMHCDEAIKIVKQRVYGTKDLIENGKYEPNMNNGIDHVFKIVCGAGHHSANRRGVLKYRINDLLGELGLDFYFFEADGTLLVHFKK